jgi:hypothetical protein
MWWIFGISAVGGLVFLVLVGRRNEAVVRRDWELLLTPKGKRIYQSVESRFQGELALADVAFEDAAEVRSLGSVDEARQLLDVGYRVIEQFSPNMLRLLQAMATFSRMVAAMAPVEPLRPRDFRLGQLASLAYLNRVLHQFLVSTSERFRLRLYILGRGFGLAGRYLLDSIQRVLRGTVAEEREWQQIEAIRHDFHSLTDESLASLRTLLSSLAAEQRDHLFSDGPE